MVVEKDYMGADAVRHPAHYNQGRIECLDYILDKKLTFCLGNAVKYGGKNKVEDLKKAIFYIEAQIKEWENNAE